MIAELSPMVGWLVWPLVMVCAALLDSIYCGMETGIYTLNKIRLDLHAEAGHRSARFLRSMLRKPNNLLAVLLIGTNICRYAATFAITSMFAMGGAGEMSEIYTIIVATPVLFVIGDAVPKGVFQRLGDRVVYAFTWLIRVSNVVFRVTLLSPLVTAISSVLMKITGAAKTDAPLAHDGVTGAVIEGQASGVLTHFQSVMADRVMRMRDVRLRDVMIPMQEVVRAPASLGRSDLARLYGQHDVSRIPLLDESAQVVGILDVYDVLATNDDRQPFEMMMPPCMLDWKTHVADALYQMRTRKAVMSIVEDTGGRHAGIITIKDLVEEIVGELQAW
jgi:CBS domain containing-hemolysin-like protein